ncbi:MAG: LPXTG cell wall anchor domain-containing protein, partial [Acidimicrobiia bacterium]|nr:LPXTG cell wall anchor domain-containing protein [Acidimicrobiia bacterium]
TDASGLYNFSTNPGSYTIRFTPPAGMTLSTPNDIAVTVTSGETNDTIDAGMFTPATIGDFTFEDFNGNGIFDGSDAPVSGVIVELLDIAGTTVLDSAISDGSGSYSFTANPGSYTIRFTPPAGMTLSTPNDIAVTVTSADSNDTVDAGMFAVATISLAKSGPITANVGDTITYTYLVGHGPASSGSDINAVSVVDADPNVTGMTLIAGDANGNSILEAIETWTYEATRNITPGDPDPLDTMATASGTDLTSTVVSDTDTHSVDIAYEPVIDLQKTGPATATVGETITYTYTVSHDPSSDGSNISNLAVADADPDVSTIVLIGGDANANDVLEAAETWIFEATYTVTFDDPTPLDTAASVIGQDPELDTVSDTDGHPVDIDYAPVIDIQKSGPAAATVGETITYSYTVSHDPSSDGSSIGSIGVTDADVDVSVISLTGGDINGNGILEATETWTFEATYSVTVDDPDPLSTNGTVIGLDAETDPVSDSDGHPVDIDFAPALDIVTDGPAVAHVNDSVTFTYAVTNDSTVGDGSPIGSVNVVDDQAGPATYVSGDTNTNDLLEVGETWRYEATYTVEATDPDPLSNTGTANGVDLDGEPVEDNDSHTIDILKPAISIAMTPPSQQAVTGGTASFSITVTNEGDTQLDNVNVNSPNSPSCDNAIGSLLPTESVTYTCDQTITADVTNTATVTGQDQTGLVVSDTASASVDHIGPSIGVAESISGDVTNNGDGTYTLTYQIEITNSGDVDLDGVTLLQDLTSTFVGVSGFTVDSVSSSDLTVNPAFDGSTNTSVLDGSDVLVPSATGTVFVTVTVAPGTAFGPHLDQVTATGVPPVGPDVTDLSDSGTNPDPANTNPGAPGDSGGSNDPTPVTFGENPVVGLAEDITGITDNGNGSYTVTYLLTVENLGDVDLSAVQITNDLATTFSAAESFVVSDIRSTDLTVDTSFDGAGQTNLVDGTDSLAVGSARTVEFDVIVTPGANSGPYDNQAASIGTSPSGIDVNDTSQAGIDPDPDNDGDPTNNSTPTSVTFESSTITGTVWIDANGDAIVDTGEESIDGVRVVLTCAGPDGVVGTPDDMQLLEDFTSGTYAFIGIFSGNCAVTVDTSTLPPGLTATFDADGGNDSVSDVTVIPGQPVTANFGYGGAFDLELLKWLANGPVDNQVTWGLNVTNVGPAASPAFEIVDTLPPSLSLIEAVGPGLTCSTSDQVVTCTHDGLAAGASATMEITTLIINSDFAVIENSALVASLGVTAEPRTNNNRGLASLNFAALPNTGAATDLVLPIALVLLGTGIAMLLVVRRKEDEDVEPR